MSVISGFANWLGGVLHLPHPQTQPVRPPQPPPRPAPNLQQFLAQHLAPAIHSVAAPVAQDIANIPNIHLKGIEQLTGNKNITVGNVVNHTPVVGQAIKFGQTAATPQFQQESLGQKTGQFIKGFTGAGVQGAGYVAPEAKILKAGAEAPLIARLGAKFVNQAVPAAGLSAAGSVVGGDRNLKSIGENALINGVAAGAMNAAPTLIRPATQGAKMVAKDAPAVLADQTGKLNLAAPLKAKAPVPEAAPIAPNQFTQHVQTSPEVSEPVQAAVSGQHAIRNTQALVDNANADIKQNGLNHVTNRVLGELSVPSGNASDESLVSAIQAAKAHDALGTDAGHDMATSLYDQIAEHGVGSGQRSQALAVLANRTPEGQRFVAQKVLKKAGVEMTPELQGAINDATTRMKNATEGTQEHYAAQQALAKVVNRALPSKNIDKVFRLFRAGLLTGPQTLSKVVLSHGVMNAMEAGKDVPAVGLDHLISAMGGHRTTALTARGQFSGAIKGTKAMGHLLHTGEDTINTGGFTGFNTELGKPQARFQSKALSWLNPYMDKVEQTHAGLPKAFYSAAHDNTLNKQAIVAYRNAGAPGDRSAFIKNFVANPTPEAEAEAKNAGEMAAFQQKTKIGDAASKIQKVPGGRWLTPFAHIASSIFTDAINYSPVGAAKTVIEAVRDGGAKAWTPQIQKHFVDGIGRSIVGTGLIATGMSLYKNGLMTLGYPTDPKERALWQANGKQENSILLGGKWRQLATLGPQALTLAMGGYAASSSDVGGKGNAATGALAGAVKTLMNESFLSGLSGGANAVSDPQQSAGTFLKSEASSVVPTLIGTVARAFDPQERTANGIMAGIQSKIPGLREMLPAKINGFGQPVPRQGGVTTNLLDPSRPQAAVNTPPLDELNRLDKTGNTVFPVPVKTIGSGVDAVKLSQAQQDARSATVGPQIEQAYQQVIAAPGYGALSDPNKAKALSNAASDVNAVGNVKLLQQIAPDKFQKAYNALSVNQKVMFAGVNSAKDYTALNDDGTAISGSTSDTPANKYKVALTSYQAQKAAGLLSPEQDFKQQMSLGKQAITSKYPQAVNDIYGMSKADRNAFIAANPAEATKYMPAVEAMDAELAAQGWISKAKFGVSSSSTTAAKDYAKLQGKINSRSTALKAVSIKGFKVKRAKVKA